MRRTFPFAILAFCALSEPASALAYAEQPEGEEEDMVILDDEDDQGAEDEPLLEAEDASPKVSEDELNSDLGFLDEDSGDSDVVGEKGSSKSANPNKKPKLSKEELEKQYERIITIVSWQPMLNVYKVRNNDGSMKTIRRWDIQPQIGLSVNDPYVRHYALGAEINYWLTNRMAIGLTATGFLGLKTNNYYQHNRQQRVLLTANRVMWQASLNYLYEFGYGKFAIFNRSLLHWESYVQLGGGAIQTQVIPRFQALHEPFTHITWQANAAIGARFYLPDTKYMSINAGVRTWFFLDYLEPFERNPSGSKLFEPDEAKAAAKAGGSTPSYNSIFFIGASFYFPTTFEYSTRR